MFLSQALYLALYVYITTEGGGWYLKEASRARFAFARRLFRGAKHLGQTLDFSIIELGGARSETSRSPKGYWIGIVHCSRFSPFSYFSVPRPPNPTKAIISSIDFLRWTSLVIQNDTTTTVGGELMNKTYEEAVELIENLAEHSHTTPRYATRRILERQVDQIVEALQARAPSQFPSQIDPINAIEMEEIEIEDETLLEEPNNGARGKVKKDTHVEQVLKPIIPKVPFPNRMKGHKDDVNFAKFL
ncbi:hypothetical protein OSB04_009343 [Centaurea solstitialis]|uniref:Uncharacterized protein n=1 Tax=Centaurea solstitialis TaxID=347529 RepID=A0AA38T5H0_9ASTR|nr:hypothetical protein OSB04_009343 [Centaurea solstitialis]